MKRQLNGEEGQNHMNLIGNDIVYFVGKCAQWPDPEHSDRWREAYESDTSERPGRPTFKNTILMVSFYSVYLRI